MIRAVPCPAQRKGRLERLEQALGRAHVRGSKALSDPIVNRLKNAPCLIAPILTDEQAGEAQRCPQLPEQHSLLARGLERVAKAIRGFVG